MASRVAPKPRGRPSRAAVRSEMLPGLPVPEEAQVVAAPADVEDIEPSVVAEMAKRGGRELLPETRLLAARLLETPIEGVVTYAELSRAVGEDIRERRYLIKAAQTVASREAGALFVSVRGIGYQRLATAQANLVGGHARQKIRRTSKRAIFAIECAVALGNDLPERARAQAFREVSALALVRHLSRDHVVEAVAAPPRPLGVAATLRSMFSKLGMA